MVNDSSPPPTIGVFGPWGVGKSTIIGALQARLRGSITAFVYFDAWRYEGDSLRRQFLIDTAAQLKRDGRLQWSYKPDKELRELEVDTQELEDSLGWSAERFQRAAILGFAFALVAGAALFLGGSDIFEGNVGQKVGLSLLVFALTFLASALSQSIVVNSTTLTRRSLQDPDRFSAKFADLLEALKPKRLVIAIDNLDRCAPDKAVEMLSTIKTYLEPTLARSSGPRSGIAGRAPKEVVFVISVDDAALRRHLVARERGQSKESDKIAVGRYVDEYLAKFFNARLPIRSILPDDMRGYVDAQIRPLAEARGVEPEDTKTLISLVDAALRGNPRGVKQFYNDLEGRLRLLEERERPKGGVPGIDPPVSPDVPMVAKLALIEAEWPEAFARLQAEPRLLGRWSAEARTKPEVDWRSPEEIARQDLANDGSTREELATIKSHREFATFLRIAARTDSSHLRALLSLKQSKIEIELPGFGDFRDALLDGESKTMSDVMGEANEEHRVRLAERVPDLLRKEVKRGYLEAALAIVDMFASGRVFEPFEDIRRQVISIAVQEPELREQLTSLDSGTILAEGALLSLAERRELLDLFIALYLDPELDDGDRRELAAVLAPHLGDFGAAQRGQIKAAITNELSAHFDVYLPLISAAPSLLPAEALEAALDLFERPGGIEPNPEQPPRVSQQTSAWAVVEVALDNLSENDKRRVMQIANHTLRIDPASIEPLEADIRILSHLFKHLELDDADSWAAIAVTIEELWGSYPAPKQPALIELDALVLARVEDGPDRAQRITNLFFSAPGQAVELIAQLDPVPSIFIEPFLNALEPLSTEPELSLLALRTVERIDPETLPERLLHAFAGLLGADQLDAVRALLDQFAAQLEAHGTELAETATPVLIGRIEADQPGPADLLGRLDEFCDDEQADRLARAYLERLPGPQGTTVVQTLEELRAQGVPRLTYLAAHYAVGRLDTEPPQPPDALLNLAALNIDKLPKEQQQEFAETLAARLLTYPDQAGAIAHQVMDVRGLPARIAKPLADALISREEIEASGADDLALRRLLHAAAANIRVQDNTRITKALDARASALEASEKPDDAEIAADLRNLLDA